jgi:hypothetical protein
VGIESDICHGAPYCAVRDLEEWSGEGGEPLYATTYSAFTLSPHRPFVAVGLCTYLNEV